MVLVENVYHEFILSHMNLLHLLMEEVWSSGICLQQIALG